MTDSSIQVTHPTGSYDVKVGFEVSSQLAGLVEVSGSSPVAIITDTNVGPLYAAKIARQFDYSTIITVPAGEAYKTLETTRTIYDQMLAAGCDRGSIVVSLGGGVINDMGGFVAATFMRGIRFVTLPTSLLSMVDASVGGKTGVDLPQGKNLIGAFKQPELVLADLHFLKSLSHEEFACGMAEIVKHGLIRQPSLLTDVIVKDWHLVVQKEVEGKEVLTDSDAYALQKLVTEAITVKRDTVQNDPFEKKGERALLNLGHTFGHAIEQVSGYSVRHGEGVAMGLVCAANLSAKLGLCDPDLQDLIEATLIGVDLPIRIPKRYDPEEIIQAMFSDKKKKGKTIRFILLKGLGEAFLTDQVELGQVIETLQQLQD